jgi:hypothetical protein
MNTAQHTAAKAKYVRDGITASMAAAGKKCVWHITSSAGADMGDYYAASEQDALDIMAREAGYLNNADAVAQGFGDAGIIVELKE